VCECVRESVCGNRGIVPPVAPRVSPVLYYTRERKNVKERERERECVVIVVVSRLRESVWCLCARERVCGVCARGRERVSGW